MTGKIYTGDELWELVTKEDERLGKQVYLEDDLIVINVEYKYEIPLHRCDTFERILGWVTHLCEKTWITPDVLRRFIYLAAGRHGLKVEMP